MIRGDADIAKKDLRRILTKRTLSWQVIHIKNVQKTRTRKVVPVKTYAANVEALLDSVASPNLISAALIE